MKHLLTSVLVAILSSITMSATTLSTAPSQSAIATAAPKLTTTAPISITDIRVQNTVAPIAVEDAQAMISWRMESSRRGAAQSAYRIQVTRDSDGSEIWDSGKVEDSRSANIPYAGVALQPDMSYSIELSVWDEQGTLHQQRSRFETGLMSPKLSAWKGAQWIGSKQLTLDAASQNTFGISTNFNIVKGNTAALIFGADDFRHSKGYFNDHGVSSKESYIKLEIEPAKPEIRIYRVGYFPGDSAEQPIVTINKANFPETNLEDIIAEGPQHSIELQVEVSDITLKIDGCDLITKTPGRRGADVFTVGMTGNETRATRIPLSIIGSGGNYPSFPNLCSVGFAAKEGSEVVYSKYQILNSGQSVDTVVFDEENYSIFAQLQGVEVEGAQIRVSNISKLSEKLAKASSQPATELRSWADPSHGAETQLRTEFSSQDKKIQKASLYATAMGIYELFINGKRVSDSYFAPGDSQYRETMGYHKYDVTSLLREGNNAIAASLTGGWYSGYMTFTAANFNFFSDYTALLTRLVIRYEDGSTQEIVSSPDSWKVWKDGPVRLGSFFQGERYDARKQTPGWTEVGYDDSAWTQAVQIEQRDWVDFDFIARYDEPVKVRELIPAKRLVTKCDAHTFIYDMGVNMVGVPEIQIPAGWLKEGDVVTLSYGEQLYPGLKGDKREYIKRFGKQGRNVAGQLLFESNRAALNTDIYIAAGSEAVTIRPTTTFRGYQYIQVNIPAHEGALPVENIKGIVLSSSEIPTASYTATTSDGNYTGKLVNQLFKNIQRSQLGNFLTLPTDCPQRNERMGWTGDAQAYVRTGTYQADVHNFFRQWMVALRDDQGIGSDTEVPGGIGSTVPTYNRSDDRSFANGTTWGAAVCQVPWQLYNQSGDTRIIEDNFRTMMDWLNGMAFYKNPTYPHLSTKTGGLADHLALDNRTPADLLNNAIYIHMMEVTAIMAEAIGKDAEAVLLKKRHAAAVEEWNRAYVDPVTGKTRGLSGKTVHTQASYATPLNFNVFNEVNKAKAAAWLAELAAAPATSGPTPEELESQKHLQDEITSAFGVLGSGNTDFNFKPYTITTGFSGTPNILPALSRNGYWEEAFRMISCTDNASWLYPVTCGATSVWERWNSYEVAFSEPNQNTMNSFNHFALGAVGQWMFEYQLGISAPHTEGEAGYKHFILQPSCGGKYTALEGSYNSHYGRISSAWTAEGQKMTSYKCTVPANTSATLYLPVAEGYNGENAPEEAIFKGIVMHNGRQCARFELCSGTWEFNL